MAKLIGTVTHITGEVFAVDASGGRRALVEGDRLFAGEQLQTGAVGAVAVHLADGGELTLGRDSSMPLTDEILANHATHVETPETKGPTQDQLADVTHIQKSIVAGDDPTTTAEPAAAGPAVAGPPGALGGGHSFVLLTEVGGHVDPVLGFPTAGFGFTPITAGYQGIAPITNGTVAEVNPVIAVTPVNSVTPINPDNSVNPASPPPPAVPPPDDSIHLNLGNGSLDVNEANLPLGSDPNPSALTQTGTFTINAPDGLKSLSVGGINVITDGAASGFPQSITTSLGSTLTVTGYNPQTGVVTYAYTLTPAETQAPGHGANGLVDNLTVVATNNDGHTASGTLNINITDDMPTAVNDTNPNTASETLLTLTGNVLTNDIQGADRIPSGPIVSGTFAGTYGTLVLAADGTYTYTLNPHDPDFIALHGGGNGTDVFTYTLKDADGDTSQATLTLQVHNNDDPVTIGCLDVSGGELTVYEKNLSNGSSPDAAALTQSGTFIVHAPDGLQTLNVGGISVVSGGVVAGFPQSITTQFGNLLTITGFNANTGVVSYSYTLEHVVPMQDGPGAINSIIEPLAVVATDGDGNHASGVLGVNIVDDMPTANPDQAGVTEGGTVSGNVLYNDVLGADGAPPTGAVIGVRAGDDTSQAVTTGVGSTIVGLYGTLVLDAFGNATYHANPNSVPQTGAEDVFTYSIRDADGATSTTTIKIEVNDSVVIGGLSGDCNDVTVYEKNLTQGSAPDSAALTQQGTFTVTSRDGLQSLNVGGISVVSGGVVAGFPQSITTQFGNLLTITGFNATTGVVSYSYTLEHVVPMQDGPGVNSIIEPFTVVATDGDGNHVSGVLGVNIVDDMPTANPDQAGVTEGGTVSGNVLYNDVLGADGAPPTGAVIGVRAGDNTSQAVTTGVGSTIVGLYGTLVLDAFGNATYHANPNSVPQTGAEDVFTYSIRDADGATSTTTIKIEINDAGLKACNSDGVTVFENALDQTHCGHDPASGMVVGSDPGSPSETGSSTLVGSVSGGSGTLTYSLVGSANGTLVGQFGVIHLNSDGSYTYTLTSAPKTMPDANDGANTTNDTFTYKATDALGNSVTAQIVVHIVDDVPIANPDQASVTVGGTVSGNVLYNDVLGADGAPSTGAVIGVRAGGDTSQAVTTGVGLTIVGQYGTLVLDAYGNGTYHANPNPVPQTGAEDVFTYSIRDGDGDISTTTIKIEISNAGIQGCNSDGVPVLTPCDPVPVPAPVVGCNPDSPPETGSSTNTGWTAKGADFTSTCLKTITFNGHSNIDANQLKTLDRSDFFSNSTALTALVVLNGYLGGANAAPANAQDLYTVTLHKGETVTLDEHHQGDGNIALQWQDTNGVFHNIADGGTFTATSDGVYHIHLTNQTASSAHFSGDYQLDVAINYAAADPVTPDVHSTPTTHDGHSGTGTANVDTTHQGGDTLQGTHHDATPIAGPGNQHIHGGDGNDILQACASTTDMHGGNSNGLLIAGPGNEVLDGGAGINTVSFAHATAGVHVDLNIVGVQDTLGAGHDTLTNIQNLIGSPYNDVLIGGPGNNVINGGGGNDILTGGGGNDTFQWSSGCTGHDLVTDFNPSTDKLDLSQLLQGDGATSSSSLDDYLHFKVTGTGANVVTSIDVGAAGAPPTQTIDLQGVNLASHYGVTPGAGGVVASGHDTATIINGMLGEHALKVDTV